MNLIEYHDIHFFSSLGGNWQLIGCNNKSIFKIKSSKSLIVKNTHHTFCRIRWPLCAQTSFTQKLAYSLAFAFTSRQVRVERLLRAGFKISAKFVISWLQIRVIWLYLSIQLNRNFLHLLTVKLALSAISTLYHHATWHFRFMLLNFTRAFIIIANLFD